MLQTWHRLILNLPSHMINLDSHIDCRMKTLLRVQMRPEMALNQGLLTRVLFRYET